MAWYYVKNGGTATGDGGRVTTERTGLWNTTASEYYDTIDDAVGATTPPGDGDSIHCSHLHSASNAHNGTNYNVPGVESGAGLSIISVDNANQELYKPGASEIDTSFDGSHRPDNNGLIAGVTLNSSGAGGRFRPAATCRFWRFIDSTIAGADGPNMNADGCRFDLVNTDIDPVTAAMLISNGASLVWRGGKMLHINLVGPGWANGGGQAFLYGVDLSDVTTMFSGTAPSATTQDRIYVKLVNCRLNTSVTLPSDTFFKLPHQRFEMWGCDDSTGNDLYRFHMQDGTGKVINNDSIYVTADTTWYESSGAGSRRSSYQVTTTAVCSPIFPFVFDMGIEYVDLSAASTDKIIVHFGHDGGGGNAINTDTDIAAYLVYPDGTTSVQPNWVTSGKTVGSGNYGTDPLATGATLPTSTIAWTGSIFAKKQMELDTSVDPGAASPIAVRLEIYTPSTKIHFFGLEYEKA